MRERLIFETALDLGNQGAYRRTLTEAERCELIRYDLHYAGDSADLEKRIVLVIARLPRRVAKYALERCVFLSIGRANHGLVLPGRLFSRRAGGQWVVLLHEALPTRHADGIIAHEIAHAWRRHDRYSQEITAECEVEASNLAAKWGFDGMGADPRHHLRKQHRQKIASAA